MNTQPVSVGRASRAGPFVVREVGYAAGLRQPPHSHEYRGVTLVISGAIRERVRSRDEFATALSVVVKPAGIEHADEVGPRGARTLQVVFGPDAAAAEPFVPHALSGWRWIHGRPAAAELLALLRLLRCAEEAPAGRIEDRVVDAIAAACGDAPAAGTPPAWIRRVRETLDDDAHAPPVRDLARAAGAHPVSASRAFRRHFGCSVSEYRQRVRLRRAAAAIEASPHDLSRVAHAAGYADHPHLCREFRRATGLTPSQFRVLSRDA